MSSSVRRLAHILRPRSGITLHHSRSVYPRRCWLSVPAGQGPSATKPRNNVTLNQFSNLPQHSLEGEGEEKQSLSDEVVHRPGFLGIPYFTRYHGRVICASILGGVASYYFWGIAMEIAAVVQHAESEYNMWFEGGEVPDGEWRGTLGPATDIPSNEKAAEPQPPTKRLAGVFERIWTEIRNISSDKD